MPNGGPDNCGTCGFNARNRGVWRNSNPDTSITPFCTIRNVQVLTDYWTYCANWHTRSKTPDGPIYASGLYEGGYRRIPWHGNVEPLVGVEGRCAVCGAEFHDGLEITQVERQPAQFCSNRHYLTWWKQQNPGGSAPMSEELFEH
jgi:hypothetical protein